MRRMQSFVSAVLRVLSASSTSRSTVEGEGDMPGRRGRGGEEAKPVPEFPREDVALHAPAGGHRLVHSFSPFRALCWEELGKRLSDELICRQADALAVQLVRVDELGGCDAVTRLVQSGPEHDKGDGDVPLHTERLPSRVLTRSSNALLPLPPCEPHSPSISLCTRSRERWCQKWQEAIARQRLARTP